MARLPREPGQIRFRAAEVGDAGSLLSVKQAAIEAIDGDAYTRRQLDAWRPDDGAVDEFERAIGSDQFEILVAQSEEILAYGVLNTREERIDAIFVHPECHDRGVGSSLVGQFESRAQVTGLPELKIVASLNARAFYERLGYWNFGRTRRRIAGVELEFAIMRKLFEPR